MRNVTLILLAVILGSYSILNFSGCSSETQQTGPDSGSSVRFAESVSTAAVSANKFYKGNIHTHTTKSDGDETPAFVTKWYKKHGYSFLAITDHNKLTIYKDQDSKNFITINGVEITGQADHNKVPVHVNALCGSKSLVGIHNFKNSVHDVMQAQVDLAKSDNNAIALFNHPNFGVESNQAMTTADVLSVDNFDLLEIASGHPRVYPEGDKTHDSAEMIWDTYLTSKHRIFGAGVDDSHHYHSFGGHEHPNPGRVWIEVWAPELSEGAICDAIRNGHFYSSNGVALNSIAVEGNTFELSVDKWKSTDYVEFIGAKGVVLSKVSSNPARYTINGGEGYVRARVVQQHGKKKAWTQPYFIQ